MSWVSSVPNYTIAISIAVLLIFWWLLSYATKLRKEKEPKVASTEIAIKNIDDEYFIRVKLINVASIDGVGITPYLDEIVCEDVLREIHRIDFPIPLYTQQRLNERISGVNKDPPRQINLRGGQPKWVEIFQRTHPIDPVLHIFSASDRLDIIPHPKMQFNCRAYGFGPPISFLVGYLENADEAWTVRLLTSDKKCIAEAKSPPREI